MHISQKFEHLSEVYRRPDGSRWGGQDIGAATGGVVTRSYITNLRKGRIESPGYDKLKAIAKAMGFPPEVWFEEDLGDGAWTGPPAQSADIAGRAEHLFGAVLNPATGGLYSNAEVARMSAGDLSEVDVEGIRTGEIPDPTVGQVAALGTAFGIGPSYFLDRGEDPSFLDGELVEALRDETVGEIVRSVVGLPEREKRLVLGIVRQFRDPDDSRPNCDSGDLV